MAQIFLNNARGTLTTSIDDLATSLTLNSVVGLPASLASGDYFLLTLYADTTRYGENIEVVKVTGLTDNGDGTWTLTVERGHEFPAVSHGALERAESRLTAGTMERIETDAQAYADGVTKTWAQVTGKPAEATRWPTFSDVTGLQAVLNDKRALLEATSSISVNTTATAFTYYILTASLILTLPATPSPGDWLRISNRSGTTTGTVARNGSNIMGLAEDMTLDTENAGFTLTYVDATQGWVIT